MNPIPQKLKQKLEKDPYYFRCALTGFTAFKIDWHHAIQIAGKQLNEEWAIIPIWWRKHSPMGDKDSVHNRKETRERVELLALKRATPQDFKKYPKANLQQRLNYLLKKYGRE